MAGVVACKTQRQRNGGALAGELHIAELIAKCRLQLGIEGGSVQMHQFNGARLLSSRPFSSRTLTRPSPNCAAATRAGLSSSILANWRMRAASAATITLFSMIQARPR